MKKKILALSDPTPVSVSNVIVYIIFNRSVS